MELGTRNSKIYTLLWLSSNIHPVPSDFPKQRLIHIQEMQSHFKINLMIKIFMYMQKPWGNYFWLFWVFFDYFGSQIPSLYLVVQDVTLYTDSSAQKTQPWGRLVTSPETAHPSLTENMHLYKFSSHCRYQRIAYILCSPTSMLRLVVWTFEKNLLNVYLVLAWNLPAERRLPDLKGSSVY